MHCIFSLTFIITTYRDFTFNIVKYDKIEVQGKKHKPRAPLNGLLRKDDHKHSSIQDGQGNVGTLDKVHVLHLFTTNI